MEIAKTDGDKFLERISVAINILKAVIGVIIGIIVWGMVIRADVNANTKTTEEHAKRIEKLNDKFDIIIDKLNEIKVEVASEKKKNNKGI